MDWTSSYAVNDDGTWRIGRDVAIGHCDICSSGAYKYRPIWATLNACGNSIIEVASRQEVTFNELMELFKEIEEKHVRNAVHADSGQNIHDLAGTRPARPWIIRMRKEIPGRTCLICEGYHKVLRCPHLEQTRKLRTPSDEIRTGKRKCSVCWYRGHNVITCPSVQRYRDQPTPSDQPVHNKGTNSHWLYFPNSSDSIERGNKSSHHPMTTSTRKMSRMKPTNRITPLLLRLQNKKNHYGKILPKRWRMPWSRSIPRLRQTFCARKTSSHSARLDDRRNNVKAWHKIRDAEHSMNIDKSLARHAPEKVAFPEPNKIWGIHWAQNREDVSWNLWSKFRRWQINPASLTRIWQSITLSRNSRNVRHLGVRKVVSPAVRGKTTPFTWPLF
jgi:hypothetical protein